MDHKTTMYCDSLGGATNNIENHHISCTVVELTFNTTLLCLQK